MPEKLRTSPIEFSGVIGDDAILGVSIATTGEAAGHRLLFDQVTLSQLQQLGSSKATGIKSRFTHPDWFHDGLGKYLGRVRNFRMHGDKLIGDLFIGKSAHQSPAGDIGSYVLNLAREDPTALGVSVVVDLDRVWTTKDGQELPAGGGRPSNATGDYPVARITALYAADVVDEPALNPDGLFQVTEADLRKLFTDEEYSDLFKEGEQDAMIEPETTPEQDRILKLEAQVAVLSRAVEDSVITIGGQPPRGQQLSEGLGAREQFQGYMDWLFGVKDAKLPPPELRRTDALYRALTGDVEMKGVFDPLTSPSLQPTPPRSATWQSMP